MDESFLHRFRHWFGAKGRAGLFAAVLSAVLGAVLANSPLGQGLVDLSYDIPFWLRTPRPPDEVVLIEMDTKSLNSLNQKWFDQWDRGLHALWLDYLRRDHARLVVFDLIMREARDPDADRELARAIRDHGSVLLAAGLEKGASQWAPVGLVRPYAPLEEAAAGWGLGAAWWNSQFTVRRHHPGTDVWPTLPWVAASVYGASVTLAATEEDRRAVRKSPRWINFYGPSGTLPSISYADATNQTAGTFSNKVVFVGLRSLTPRGGEHKDEFRTPFSRWSTVPYTSGMEILATSFLNLIREDWLIRMAWWKELLVLLVSGGALGFGLCRFRPWMGVLASMAAGVAVAALAMICWWGWHVWFPWMIVVAAQIPAALFCAVVSYRSRPAERNETPASSSTVTVEWEDSPAKLPRIPDHELLRYIGQGAFGQVWLARNPIGMYRAVKIVYRDRFENVSPYEREFHGIKSFMPVSLSYPGFLKILHLGRAEREGYFFYIMEVGDDALTGSSIDPAAYRPRNLSSDLVEHGVLPLGECLSLMLELTKTLEHLHEEKGLIHRDIKPSNIIYVEGHPKLADVGLVTEAKSALSSNDATIVGTLRWMPDPQSDWVGWGTAAVDLYSVGKVFYRAALGKEPVDYPDLPTDLVDMPHQELLMDCNNIICKACETDPDRRYRSAREMHDDLLSIWRRLPTKD